MSTQQRGSFDAALQRARVSAYPPGEFVGQESFMRAEEILSLATRAGITAGTSVLDLCCGVAGPGRLVARELGCRYTGVDASVGAVEIARERAAGLDCGFLVAVVPPLPSGRFEVVLLLETMLAFRDKETLVREVARALPPGGRFGFTLEEGRPLTDAERERMPDADTVWLTPLPEMVACLENAGLHVQAQWECTGSHLAIVDALVDALQADADAIAAGIGGRALEDLLTAHRLWSAWFRAGRARKFGVVAEKQPTTAL